MSSHQSSAETSSHHRTSAKGAVTVSAGTTALTLAVVGWGLRLLAVSTIQEQGGIEAASLTAVAGAFIGAVLLAIAGLLGIYGLVKNDGRVTGLCAVLGFAAFASKFAHLLR